MMDMDRVPWLSRKEIGRKAALVLRDASQVLGMEMAPPVPIEAIIEQVFGLHLLVEDLGEMYAGFSWADELLGATILSKRQVLVHEKLLADPKEHGRYHFTCAHELGHWVLHRPHCRPTAHEEGTPVAGQDILCRTSFSKQRGEWQADYMAACLLMPEASTREAFHSAVSPNPLLLVNRQASVSRGGSAPPLWPEPVLAHIPIYAQEVIRAGNFSNVSRSAMGIRLRELGLLVDAVNRPWVG